MPSIGAVRALQIGRVYAAMGAYVAGLPEGQRQKGENYLAALERLNGGKDVWMLASPLAIAVAGVGAIACGGTPLAISAAVALWVGVMVAAYVANRNVTSRRAVLLDAMLGDRDTAAIAAALRRIFDGCAPDVGIAERI